MGSSFTEFKWYGFWLHDHFLEEWLRHLAAEGRKQMPLESWLVQATGIFNGWIHANLNEFLVDTKRVSLIISVSERVKNNFPPNHFLNKTGGLFVRLLKGELLTDASSPLDYMVGTPAA